MTLFNTALCSLTPALCPNSVTLFSVFYFFNSTHHLLSYCMSYLYSMFLLTQNRKRGCFLLCSSYNIGHSGYLPIFSKKLLCTLSRVLSALPRDTRTFHFLLGLSPIKNLAVTLTSSIHKSRRTSAAMILTLFLPSSNTPHPLLQAVCS